MSKVLWLFVFFIGMAGASAQKKIIMMENSFGERFSDVNVVKLLLVADMDTMAINKVYHNEFELPKEALSPGRKKYWLILNDCESIELAPNEFVMATTIRIGFIRKAKHYNQVVDYCNSECLSIITPVSKSKICCVVKK